MPYAKLGSKPFYFDSILERDLFLPVPMSVPHERNDAENATCICVAIVLRS